MRYKCVKKCFWKNTLYEPGDVVEADAKVKVPEHFKEVSGTRIEGQGTSEEVPGDAVDTPKKPVAKGKKK